MLCLLPSLNMNAPCFFSSLMSSRLFIFSDFVTRQFLVHLVCFVGLVNLVCFVDLVCFVGFVNLVYLVRSLVSSISWIPSISSVWSVSLISLLGFAAISPISLHSIGSLRTRTTTSSIVTTEPSWRLSSNCRTTSCSLAVTVSGSDTESRRVIRLGRL